MSAAPRVRHEYVTHLSFVVQPRWGTVDRRYPFHLVDLFPHSQINCIEIVIAIVTPKRRSRRPSVDLPVPTLIDASIFGRKFALPPGQFTFDVRYPGQAELAAARVRGACQPARISSSGAVTLALARRSFAGSAIALPQKATIPRSAI